MKVRLYEHITFHRTKWGIFVYDDNSIKDFVLQLFMANFCLLELMFGFPLHNTKINDFDLNKIRKFGIMHITDVPDCINSCI
jgi:hypothetical protein